MGSPRRRRERQSTCRTLEYDVASRTGVASAAALVCESARTTSRHSWDEVLETSGEIRVLGVVAAATCAAPVSLPGTRTRELLAALAARKGDEVRRESLFTSLWPERPETAARKSLNTELWRLRTAIRDANGDPERWLASTLEGVRLCPENGLHIDVLAFHSALVNESSSGPASVLEALELYEGDFAEGLDAEWIAPIRGQLRRRFVRALERTVDDYCQERLFEEASPLAERLVAEEPFDERGHRALLLIRIQAGEHAEAVRHYRELSRMFRDELGIDPAPETRALVEELLETSRPPRNFRVDQATPCDSSSDLGESLAALRETAERLLGQIESLEREFETEEL